MKTTRVAVWVLMCMACLLGSSHNAWPKSTAQSKPVPNKYASIIIDVASLEILHARQIDQARFPASLTKMMTLYLTFDALESGQLKLNEAMPISAFAARTAPVKLGLKAGKTITARQAIQALTVRSANDAAVVLAERLSGSIDEFAYAMNIKAKSLGMQSSIFKNPHGLPNKDQTTTARDMAKLANGLLENHPQYYHYFSQASFTYHGRTYKNHNRLLGKVNGVDGFKTGFTNASGYNLVLSAKRDGRRIIAVVLGGASGKSRNTHMSDLIERGFDVLLQNKARISNHAFALNADTKASKTIKKILPVPKQINSFTLRAAYGGPSKTVNIVRGAGTMRVGSAPHNGWAVQIGAYGSQTQAHKASAHAKTQPALGLMATLPRIIPVQRNNHFIYRAQLVGLSHQSAVNACKTLAARRQSCLVIAP